MATARIYMDNAATSFPKPPGVLEAMTNYAQQLGASPGRGSYAEAQEAGRLISTCRERINRLINGQDPNHVVFTLNATDALNMAIHGLVRDGDHLITTWLDHNSVLRPFNTLVKNRRATQTRLRCDPATGLINPGDIKKAIRPNTRLIAIAHGSNVTGTVQPLREIGKIAREAGVLLLVDAAQTIGHLPIDVQADYVDLLAFPGHKGLLGPLGTGGLYIKPGVEKLLQPYREGGTGSVSEQDTQPLFMPDRYESGSHNAIGIIGLSQGVQWILDRGIESLWGHEQGLIKAMLDILTSGDLPGLTMYGPPTIENRCAVFSLRHEGIANPNDFSEMLESQAGVLTRSGLHCAPLAHQTIGTYDLGGTTRLSFGPFIQTDDIKLIGQALANICQAHAAVGV